MEYKNLQTNHKIKFYTDVEKIKDTASKLMGIRRKDQDRKQFKSFVRSIRKLEKTHSQYLLKQQELLERLGDVFLRYN